MHIYALYIYIYLFIYYHYQHGTSPDTRGRNHDSILTPQKAPRCLETPDERCTSSRRSQGKQTYISQMGNLPVYYGTPPKSNNCAIPFIISWNKGRRVTSPNHIGGPTRPKPHILFILYHQNKIIYTHL